MKKSYLIIAAACFLALIAGPAMAQNLLMDSGFDGTSTHYSTQNSNTGEWFNVYIMGEPGLPWVSCNRFWFTNVTYGWSSVADDSLRSGQFFYTPADLAPGATGGLENIGGLFGQWNGEGSFFQNVFVNPGTRYRFSGYYWADGEFGDTLSQGQLWVDPDAGFSKVINATWGRFGGAHPREQLVVDGQMDLVGATQIVNVTAASGGWQSFSYDFTASSYMVGLASRLNVGSAGVSTTNKGWYTDNWSLTEVPEPGSLLAVAVGLIGLVGTVRRRR